MKILIGSDRGSMLLFDTDTDELVVRAAPNALGEGGARFGLESIFRTLAAHGLRLTAMTKENKRQLKAVARMDPEAEKDDPTS